MRTAGWNRLRELLPLKLMYWAARFGLGFAFIVSGMRKLPGVLFTILPTTDPVGHYFDAMHQPGSTGIS